MQLINPMLPYNVVNRIYKANFKFYKYLYFLYKYINEKEEIEFIKSAVKPGMKVLDIGANVGFYSLILSDLVGETGRVYCFEPEKNNFLHLKELCKGRKNIILNNVAVGMKEGFINLYLSDNLNVDHLTYDNNENRKKVKIKCLTIDKYLKGINKVDFIKIDTQGFEYSVIRGMKNTLKKYKNIILLSEFSHFDLEQAGGSHKDYTNFLKKEGFKIKFLEKDYKKRLYSKNQGRMSYVNLIATKS